jgi:hypothetical protein
MAGKTEIQLKTRLAWVWALSHENEQIAFGLRPISPLMKLGRKEIETRVSLNAVCPFQRQLP